MISLSVRTTTKKARTTMTTTNEQEIKSNQEEAAYYVRTKKIGNTDLRGTSGVRVTRSGFKTCQDWNATIFLTRADADKMIAQLVAQFPERTFCACRSSNTDAARIHLNASERSKIEQLAVNDLRNARFASFDRDGRLVKMSVPQD